MQLARAAYFLSVLLVAAPSTTAARSATPPTKTAPSEAELEPPPAGEAGVPDYAVLLRTAAEAYRKAPSPDQLYRLGALESILGHTVEAQDLMRRYLADPLTDATAPQRVEAERVLEFSRVPSGEVQVAAEQDGLISVDGRLVGALPLPLPLLVPVGQHTVSLEMRDKTMRGKVKVLDGRGVVVRFSPESGAVVVTLPPAVIVVSRYSGLPVQSDWQRRLRQTTEQTISKARLAVYSKDAALLRAPQLGDCLTTQPCQAQLAQKSEVEYVLELAVERRPAPKDFLLRARLIDGETEELAASMEKSCDGLTFEATNAALAQALTTLLKDGAGRPRGTLSVTSQPPGAEVRMGGRLLGKTPYEHAIFAGSYELVVEQPNYAPSKLQIVVSEGKKATTEVTLMPVAPKLEPVPVAGTSKAGPRLSRPRWRLITGGLLIGAGLVLGGVGLSGVLLDDKCVMAPVPPAVLCRERFDTQTTGASLLGTGGALSAAGIILMAVPRFPGESVTRR